MIQLKNAIEKFSNVVHIGDIHIRLVQRHAEYLEVFSELYTQIDKTPDSTLIVVAGDIFHNKSDLSPESVRIASDFLKNLADRRPTILIAGNHDATLTNRNRLDSLSPIVSALSHPNLYYLIDTDSYIIGDVLFHNYSVFDEPENYTPYATVPSIYKNQVSHTIGLYHGPVDGAITDVGYSISNKNVTIEKFNGLQMVMLGDIHKHQILQQFDDINDKPVITYCGSLIQQDHGENLRGHGYLYWDLKTKSFTHHELKNDYGFFTVEVNKGVLTTDITNIPKKAILRVKCIESIQSEVKSVLSEIKDKTEVAEVSYVRVDDSAEKQDLSSVAQVNIQSISDVEYQNTLIKTYFENKKIIVSDAELEKIYELNKSFNAELKKEYTPKNIRWKPKIFEFDNMFSYGEGNIVDFSKMNGVMGLFASNASGKSSILSALAFCLFDKCERTSKASSILNSQKMTFKCKFNFEIDGVDYFIERNATSDKTGNVKVDVNFWKLLDGKKVSLNGEKRASTNDIIRDYIGTYDDFIFTTLSVQNSKDGGFIDMGHSDRKDLLVQFMGLNIFDKLNDIATKKANKTATLLESMVADDYESKIQLTHSKIEESKNRLKKTNDELDKLVEHKDKLDANILQFTTLLVPISDSIASSNITVLEASKIDLEKSINKDETVTIPAIKIDISKQEAELEKMRPMLLELDEKNLTENSTKFKKASIRHTELERTIGLKIEQLNNKKEKLKKLENHKYDPNCDFCVNNVFVKDAINTKSEIESDKAELVPLMNEFKETKAELESLNWVVTAQELHPKLSNKILSIESSISKLNSNILRVQNTIDLNKSTLVKVVENIEMYYKQKESIEKNTKVSNGIKQLKIESDDTYKQIKLKNKDVSDLTNSITAHETNLVALEESLGKRKELEFFNSCYSHYLSAVNRDGIPYELIIQMMPVIEKEVNDILHQIVDFTLSFSSDGKNIITNIVYDDKKWLVELGSGMEKFISSLAIRRALISISNLPRPNFIIFDEGWGTLDAQHISEVKLLFDYLKTQFDFIMIISHIDSIKDLVDNLLEITKNEGFSQIKYL
jgi:DNA repair exonuclease SbcCD ATPase subunit/predicted MPP superfamily phosphohydrolase